MHYFKDYRVIPVYLCNNMNLAHFDAVVEGGHVQRAASLAVGDGGGVRAPRQHPADEVLPAGVDGLVEGDVAAVVLYRVVQLFLLLNSGKCEIFYNLFSRSLSIFCYDFSQTAYGILPVLNLVGPPCSHRLSELIRCSTLSVANWPLAAPQCAALK